MLVRVEHQIPPRIPDSQTLGFQPFMQFVICEAIDEVRALVAEGEAETDGDFGQEGAR